MPEEEKKAETSEAPVEQTQDESSSATVSEAGAAPAEVPTGVVGQGPFSVTIEWSTDDQEARDAAQPFIAEMVKTINEGDGSEVPAAITKIIITRL